MTWLLAGLLDTVALIASYALAAAAVVVGLALGLALVLAVAGRFAEDDDA